MGLHTTLLADAESDWRQSITEAFGGRPPLAARWMTVATCIEVLQPFMGLGRNRCFRPTGGGVDLDGVCRSDERGSIEFEIGFRSVETAKPKNLWFEYFEAAPEESFFLLELGRLAPCWTYEQVPVSREFAAIKPRLYADADGCELAEEKPIALLTPTRLVTRWLGGKIMIVSPSSHWARTANPYDGRHNDLTSLEIRTLIEAAL